MAINYKQPWNKQKEEAGKLCPASNLMEAANLMETFVSRGQVWGLLLRLALVAAQGSLEHSLWP